MAKYFVIALLCIVGATISKAALDKEALIKELMATGEECMNKVGATKTDLDELVKHQPASTKEGRCMRACIMKKYRLLDDNGKFVKAVGMEHAKFLTENDPEKMKIATEMNDACAGIAVPDDHCDAAEAYGKCFKEQAKAHGIEKIDL